MHTTCCASAALLLAGCAGVLAAQPAPGGTAEGPLPATITSNLPIAPGTYRLDVVYSGRIIDYTPRPGRRSPPPEILV